MPGDLLDVVLVAAAALFALAGYRRGFVVGALSFAGFLGGGASGARVAPSLAATAPLRGYDETIVGLAVVLVLAVLGQLVASRLGARLRASVRWRPARLVDAAVGAAVSVIGLLLVTWLVGSAVATAPSPSLASQVRRSAVLGAVDAVLPDRARRTFQGFRRLVADRRPGAFVGLFPTRTSEVPPADPTLAVGPEVTAARRAVLKVTGVAPSCSRRIEGSGFVYAPERVMTNAHVVAGVRDPVVQVGSRQLPARVVLYDPARDLAVLGVRGLRVQPLAFAAAPAAPRTAGIVVGYPQDGPLRADAARVRETQRARGPDIYGGSAVVREVYALRGLVQPGNSGGPLLDGHGRVLGVVFAAAVDDSDTGYALTAGEAAADAAAGATSTARVSTQGCD